MCNFGDMEEKEEHFTQGTPELEPMENTRHSNFVPPTSETPNRGISQ